MCNDPYCTHPYLCSKCAAPCNEDEVEGCADCLPDRIQEKLDELTELVSEAVDHIDDGRPVHVLRYDGISAHQRDLMPRLFDLCLLNAPEFDEVKERRRLRMVPR